MNFIQFNFLIPQINPYPHYSATFAFLPTSGHSDSTPTLLLDSESPHTKSQFPYSRPFYSFSPFKRTLLFLRTVKLIVVTSFLSEVCEGC